MKSTKTFFSLKRILFNNIYVLKIIFKVVPELCYMLPLRIIVYSIIQFLSNVWILQYIINGFQSGMNCERIIVVIISVYASGFIIKQLFAFYENVRAPKLYLRLEEHLQKIVYNKNLNVEYECYEDKNFYDKYVRATGNLFSRIMAVFQSVLSLVHVTVTLMMYSFFIISIDPVLIVFVILPVTVSVILGKKKNSVKHDYDMKVKDEERQMGYTERSFYLVDFAKEMRLTNIYKVMIDRFERSVKNIISYIHVYGFKIATIEYIVNESQEVLSCFGAMLYAIHQTLVSGSMQYGDCLVVINSIQSLIYTLVSVSNSIMAFHGHSLYIDTIREYLDYEPKIKEGVREAPSVGSVRFDNVTFRYKGANVDALKNICLEIKPGEKIALVGNNGAGKSTIVKLLLRLYDPTQGEIYFSGENIKSYKLTEYRDRYAVVFQDARLFSMSVVDNVLLRRKKDCDEIVAKDALRNAECIEKINTFENGIHSVLTREFDESGKVLSGGEAQKITIARAFAKESSIIILDEPSSALDPVAEYKMYNTLMKVCEGKSVVFISHRFSSAVLSDRVIFMENGEISEEGTHQELIEKDGKYAKMFKLQAENYVKGDS